MTITVPLQILDLHGDGVHPLVNVMIHDKPFTLVLDTGASKTAFDHDTFNQFEDVTSITSSDRLSTGLGTNNMISFTAIINNMFIGDLLVSEFEVAVLDLSSINIAYRQLNHPEVLGVLGGDILMRYKAVIDYGKKSIKFRI
jgi:hypothetical protein